MPDLLAAVHRKARLVADWAQAALDALAPRPVPLQIPVRVGEKRARRMGCRD